MKIIVFFLGVNLVAMAYLCFSNYQQWIVIRDMNKKLKLHRETDSERYERLRKEAINYKF